MHYLCQCTQCRLKPFFPVFFFASASFTCSDASKVEKKVQLSDVKVLFIYLFIDLKISRQVTRLRARETNMKHMVPLTNLLLVNENKDHPQHVELEIFCCLYSSVPI